MTLILHTLSPWALHVSSDYRLTDINTLELIDDQAGSKQISCQHFAWSAQLAFTGIAGIGNFSTRMVLSNIVSAFPRGASVGELATEIAGVLNKQLSPLPLRGRKLTIMINAREQGELKSIIISNFNLPDRQVLEVPREKLDIFNLSNSKPSYFVAGTFQAIDRQQRDILNDIAKSHREPHSAQGLLSEINKEASLHEKYGRFISPGCYIHSLLRDGTSTGRNFGETSGIPDMYIGGFNMGEWARKNLRPVPGEEIKLDGVSGMSSGDSTKEDDEDSSA